MGHQLFEQIRAEHGVQKDICDRLLETTDNSKKKKLLAQLSKELIPHMEAEEASMFNELKKINDDDVHDNVMEAYQEHHAAQLIWKELVELSPDGEVFKAKAKVLTEMNNHHIEEEEEDIFGDIEDNFDKAAMDEMYRRFQKEREEALGRMK